MSLARRLALLCALAPWSLAPLWAQGAPRLQTKEPPLARLSLVDLPALLRALPGTGLGRLFAEADVAAAIATGQRNYAAKVETWRQLLRLARGLGIEVDVDDLAEDAVFGLDWRDFTSGTLLAGPWPDDAEYPLPFTAVLLEPSTAAESRLAAAFEAVAAQIGAIERLERAKEQRIDGAPAHRFVPRNPGQGDWPAQLQQVWMLHLPGQFAFGNGDANLLLRCAPPPSPPEPGIELELDVARYLGMLGGLRNAGGDRAPDKVLAALGLDKVRRLRWRLHLAGGLLQDDLSLECDGAPAGLLAALTDAVAPLPDQPLPADALLQLRLPVDVGRLLDLADELLPLVSLPPVAAPLRADLRAALTGGLALAVVRPARGGLVPRLYVTFGIADRAAADRALAALFPDGGPIRRKAVDYEGVAAEQLRLPGLPPAWQPAFCFRGDTLLGAESGASLRAQLRAAAAGAPPALDVGNAAPPPGKGALLPGFDLRFDGAAIYRAVVEVWQPLWRATVAGRSDFGPPLVPAEAMPDVGTVVAHLGKGRGALRRLPDRLALGMRGTAGGPEMHGLLAAYGPMFSGPMTWSWRWRTEALERQVVAARLARVQAALAKHKQRTGKLPADLAELLPDLQDPTDLLAPLDDRPEPITGKDGKQVGASSFRYYPAGIKVSPQGNEVNALLIEVRAQSERRMVVDDQGAVLEDWGGMGRQTLEEIEKNARR